MSGALQNAAVTGLLYSISQRDCIVKNQVRMKWETRDQRLCWLVELRLDSIRWNYADQISCLNYLTAITNSALPKVWDATHWWVMSPTTVSHDLGPPFCSSTGFWGSSWDPQSGPLGQEWSPPPPELLHWALVKMLISEDKVSHGAEKFGKPVLTYCSLGTLAYSSFQFCIT